MAKRTIDHTGKDEPKPQGTTSVPVWHAIVGKGWRPVQFGEKTKEDDQVLRACGWSNACDAGGFLYVPEMRPRRRREPLSVSITITGERDGEPFVQQFNANTGDRFQVGSDGSLRGDYS